MRQFKQPVEVRAVGRQGITGLEEVEQMAEAARRVRCVIRSHGRRDRIVDRQARRTSLRNEHQVVLTDERPVVPVQPGERILKQRVGRHQRRRANVVRNSPVRQRRFGERSRRSQGTGRGRIVEIGVECTVRAIRLIQKTERMVEDFRKDVQVSGLVIAGFRRNTTFGNGQFVLPQRTRLSGRQAVATFPRGHALFIGTGVGIELRRYAVETRQVTGHRINGQVGIRNRIVGQQWIGQTLQVYHAVVIGRSVLDQFRIGVERRIQGRGSVSPFVVGQRRIPDFARRTGRRVAGHRFRYTQRHGLIDHNTDRGLNVRRERFRCGGRIPNHLGLMLSQIQTRFQHDASGTGVVQSATFHCGGQAAEGCEVFGNAVTVQVERSVGFIHGLAGRTDYGVTTRQNRRDGKVGEVRRFNSSDRTGERREVNAAFNGAHRHPFREVPMIRVPELISSLRDQHPPDREWGRTGRHLIQQYAGGPGAAEVVVVKLARLPFVARPWIVELNKEPAPRTQALIEVRIGIRRIGGFAVDRQIFRSPIVKRERFAEQ